MVSLFQLTWTATVKMGPLQKFNVVSGCFLLAKPAVGRHTLQLFVTSYRLYVCRFYRYFRNYNYIDYAWIARN